MSPRGAAGDDLSPGACAGALACLPGMGPATLHRLLAASPPTEVWEAVRAGAIRRPAGRDGRDREPAWAEVARRLPVPAMAEAWQIEGIGVTWPGDQHYPTRLVADPEPPGVLFWRGRLDHLDARCVALVGTRRCSPDGRASAYQMGRELAAAGICVVSGLALGIDGAAHLGALDGMAQGLDPTDGCTAGGGAGGGGQRPGGTVGVAASGVDVVYPAQHVGLWSRVAEAGAVLSENPPGRPAQAWRFPSRNRVIAALAEVVVVVESHAAGGSLITAEKAIDRGIEVRVVPGPVHSAAAAGSNQLLYDGPGPVRDATDVLDVLGLLAPRAGPPAGSRPVAPRPERMASNRPPGRPAGRRTAPDPPVPAGTAEVLDAVGWRPTSLSRVVERAGVGVGAASRALESLRSVGLVSEEGGWWTRSAVPGPGQARRTR